MIDVLLVSPYVAVRAGLHALLSGAEDLRVIGERSGGDGALEHNGDDPPDVVLFDGSGGGESGELARIAAALGGAGVETGLVVLGDSPASDLPLLARAPLGGWAYLSREADASEIAGAVRAAAAGLIALDRGLSPHLLAVAPLPPPAPPRRQRGNKIRKRI